MNPALLCQVRTFNWDIGTAYNGFKPENRQEIENNYKIIHSDVGTIEKIGGGSARCMVAEIF